jgi:hypothetical protein
MVDSPGPAAYAQKTNVGTATPIYHQTPSWSFGEGEEAASKKKAPGVASSSSIRPPGPGAYNQKSAIGGQSTSDKPTAANFKFGTSQRGKYGKQYAGMPIMNPDPTQSHPGFTYAHNATTFANQANSKKPSAPGFSFGGGTTTIARKPRPRQHHSPNRPQTSPAKKPVKDNYDWLYPSRAKKQAKSDYEKRLDGCDMPRAKEFNIGPKIGFGSDRRFNDANYMPQNAVGKSESPGPVYILPPTLGDAHATYSCPMFSFPVVTSRLNPAVERSIREDKPGPGAYNTLLEQRLDAALTETRRQQQEETMLLKESLTEDELMQYLAAEAAEGGGEDDERINPYSHGGSSLYHHTAHLKYGSIPDGQTAPCYSFGTGNRAGRAKQFAGGALNKDMEGTDSPGPNSAVRREQFGKSQVGPGRGEDGTPSYSFGGAGVERNPKQHAESDVGPAYDTNRSQLSQQPLSGNPSAPDFRIGTASRDKMAKLYQPGKLNGGFGAVTPGPQYEHAKSIGNQRDSRRRTAPDYKFSNSKRPPLNRPNDVPGPGAYGEILAPENPK